MDNQEKRSESVFLYVTPTVKKQLEELKDNDSLKESIIRGFLKTETEWLNQELKQIDEYTIKYKAKLIGIKEVFQQNQDAYLSEIDAIYQASRGKLNSIDTLCENINKQISRVENNLNLVSKGIQNLDLYKVEKLLNVIDKFNNMSKEELSLLGKLLEIKE